MPKNISRRFLGLSQAEEDPSLGVPAQVYPISAGLYGGLLGGLAMIPFAIAYGLLSGNGIWYPVNLIAATLIRTWQNASPPELAQFNLSGLVVGLALHILISIILGIAYEILLPTLPGRPQIWALVVGPLLWSGTTFAGLPLLNPVMAQLVDVPSFALANIAYSLVLGTWVARTPKVPAN